VDSGGRSFMDRFHPASDLAPRDVVARAIAAEAARGETVFLDARTALGAAFAEHFPAVFEACRAAGLDPRVDPIPVKPAAHYHMGGVAADAWGRTSLSSLFAVGETASSGVHGANRLASNSLLEAVVFGRRAGEAARAAISSTRPAMAVGHAPATPAAALAALRRRMTDQAGVTRDSSGLTDLVDWIDRQTRTHGLALPFVTARLVASAALARRESRGAHFRADYPTSLDLGLHSRLRSEPVVAPRTRAA
ncbi:MAG TPA: FAD-binding protein, partial [Caulobacteraceae bacterium]